MTLHYRITVRGKLHRDFTAPFGAVAHPDNGTTVLEGTTVDRAQVDGILDHLRDLGIEVMRFDIDQADIPDDRARASSERHQQPEGGDATPR